MYDLDEIDGYKEVIVCGHSYGGSILSRIAKNLNNLQINPNTKKLINFNKLKMYSFGSIYIPRLPLPNINIIHFMNYSNNSTNISFRLSKTNFNELIKSKIEKNIVLPHEFDYKKIFFKYFISKNNKQILYIKLRSNDNKNNIKKRSIFSISKEWNIHINYFYIQFSIINYEDFSDTISDIIK